MKPQNIPPHSVPIAPKSNRYDNGFKSLMVNKDS